MQKRFNEFDQSVQSMMQPQTPTAPVQDELANSPNYQRILEILHAKPILVEWARVQLEQKLAELAKAELDLLYSPDEQAEMRKRYGLD